MSTNNEVPNFVSLTPDEVRKIQEERRPPTPEELAEIQKNAKPRRFETAEFFSAFLSAKYGIKIEEKNELSEKTREKISELIGDIKKREGEKEKRGEIPLQIISISATNKEVMFTFDYFNEIATQKYDFVNQKWGDLLKIPKLEFDQFDQSVQ